MAEQITATIVSPGRTKEITVGVNGEVKKFPVNTPVLLEEYQKEALENAGYQLVVSDDKATASAEGSALAVDQGPDNNRTEPHQGEVDPVGEPLSSVQARDADGAPVLVGGDEPDPKVHTITGDGITGSSKPADADASTDEKKSLPALTGKTTAELEAIAKDEGVEFGEDVTTNPKRIEAIQAHRDANA